MATWNSDLCDCLTDCSICCYGCFCLPCLVGENATKVRNSGFIKPCCCFLCGFFIPGCYACVGGNLRRDIREKFGLPQVPMGDCCTYCCCASCAACQEARELKSRRIMSAPVLAPVTPPAVVHI
eukprot:TRINITY_DN3148_c0_g1_i2.p5 TRINITY_DN3148_c0_g1~~TRINITY_DN3148_c0_g1_i2.p5  ORF type:complete len:124 (-),score=6.84 TRINITY_DN3148_c0_g1_i2:422-793(-)